MTKTYLLIDPQDLQSVPEAVASRMGQPMRPGFSSAGVMAALVMPRSIRIADSSMEYENQYA